MDNEVVIHVRVKNEGKTGFEAIGRDADTSARNVSNSFTERVSTGIRQGLTQRLAGAISATGGPADQAGRSFAERFSDSFSTRVNERVTRDVNGRLRDVLTGRYVKGGEGGNGGDAKVSVDVDKQSLFSRLFSAGEEGAGKFGDGFKEGFSTIAGGILSGDVVSSIVKGLSVTVLAGLLAPVLGAAFTTAIETSLGGGLIAVGVASAFQDKRIQGAAKNFKYQLQAAFAGFGDNFKGPILNFIQGGDANGGGGLVGVLRQITPMLNHLGEVLGPVAEQIGRGIIGFLQNALPGILRAIEKSAPILRMLGDKLPMLGDSLGRFFDRMGDGAPQAAIFFGDLLEGIGLVIRGFGWLIETLTNLYLGARTVFVGITWLLGQVLHAAAESFGWIPGIGDKLKEADGKFQTFFKKLDEGLKQDRNVDISIRFKVFGTAAASAAVRTATLLHNLGYAHGGIVGAATGGLHGGLRMVGEHGPELVELPPGTRVNSNADTERIMGSGGGGIPAIIVQLAVDGRVLAEQMIEPTRELVRQLGGGSVQRYLGQAGVA